MACSEFEGSIAAAVYGQLAGREKSLLDKHLESCASCRRDLDEFRKVAFLMGRGPARVRVMRRNWAPWAAVAAVAVLAVALYLALRPASPTTPPVAVQPTPAPKAPPSQQVVPPPAPEPIRDLPAPPSIQPVPAPVPPKPAPVPEKPAEAPRPEPTPAPPVEERKTIVVVATVESVRGEASVKAGDGVVAGQDLRVAGRATIVYKDGTRVALGPETAAREETGESGKRLVVAKGTAIAVVAKQARPMVFATPNAEARVLGTELTLSVAAAETRLEVREGRVKLTRLEDGASAEVTAGHGAAARAGKPPRAELLPVTNGLLALYTFRGNACDLSGVGEPLDLRIQRKGAVAWTVGGLALNANTHLTTDGPATKIVEACRKSNEITLEAWVRPAKGEAAFDGVIVALSADNQARNFALSQGDFQAGPASWAATLRTTSTDAGGRPPLVTPKGTTEARLTHVVYTRNAAGLEKLYLDGVERASGKRPGSFAGWNESYRLELGDEITEERPWHGEYRRVAVYGRALASAEVARNFKAGAD